MNSIALIAFTDRGCSLACDIAAGLAGVSSYRECRFALYAPERFGARWGMEPYGELAAWAAEHFAADDALVFVGASGIAVRTIAPHVKDKFTDPAVVSVDEAGRFAVPLLSGHVGGANNLARAIAAITGGSAAISTATDVNGLFAVDEWAARNGMCIVERAEALRISSRLLEGGEVGFVSDFDFDWELPAGVVDCGKPADTARCGTFADADSCACDVGFAVSLDDTVQPFEHTLHLVPRIVTVGVGCRRNADSAVLEQAVDRALETAHVSGRAVRMLASIDVKQDERAIWNLAESRGWHLRFYTAEQLNAVPGEFTASEFVRKTVGVDNVCERAALAQGGTLVLGKQPSDGTTVALAVDDSWTQAAKVEA